MLAHGAGTPIGAPLMEQLAVALANRRIATFRYNYPYSEGMSTYDPNHIDSLEVLLRTTSAAIAAAQGLLPNLPFFLGGRSMSAQVVSFHLAQSQVSGVRGLVLYVYPLNWQVLLRDTVGHLVKVSAPMLFIQGGRDEQLAPLAEFQPAVEGLGYRAQLHVVGGADHEFNTFPNSGQKGQGTIEEVATVTAMWMQAQAPG